MKQFAETTIIISNSMDIFCDEWVHISFAKSLRQNNEDWYFLSLTELCT